MVMVPKTQLKKSLFWLCPISENMIKFSVTAVLEDRNPSINSRTNFFRISNGSSYVILYFESQFYHHYYNKGFLLRQNIVANTRKSSLKKLLRWHVVANMSSQIIRCKRVICDDMCSRNCICNDNYRK